MPRCSSANPYRPFRVSALVLLMLCATSSVVAQNTSFDFSLGKSFRFPLPRETGELQIRVDAQNVFNHPNFGQPDQYVGVGGAAIITSLAGSPYGARQIQLGARLSF